MASRLCTVRDYEFAGSFRSRARSTPQRREHIVSPRALLGFQDETRPKSSCKLT